MQRREATLLLRELLDFPEVVPFTCVYLKPHRGICDPEDVELHVKTNSDSSTRKIIERLAQKHSFLTKDEPGGFLVIYTRERKLLEITA
jgi:hypothetical protein